MKNIVKTGLSLLLALSLLFSLSGCMFIYSRNEAAQMTEISEDDTRPIADFLTPIAEKATFYGNNGDGNVCFDLGEKDSILLVDNDVYFTVNGALAVGGVGIVNVIKNNERIAEFFISLSKESELSSGEKISFIVRFNAGSATRDFDKLPFTVPSKEIEVPVLGELVRDKESLPEDIVAAMLPRDEWKAYDYDSTGFIGRPEATKVPADAKLVSVYLLELAPHISFDAGRSTVFSLILCYKDGGEYYGIRVYDLIAEKDGKWSPRSFEQIEKYLDESFDTLKDLEEYALKKIKSDEYTVTELEIE